MQTQEGYWNMKFQVHTHVPKEGDWWAELQILPLGTLLPMIHHAERLHVVNT